MLIFGYFYLQSTLPVSVSATFTSEGNAQFTYTTPQRETYSPACGCWIDKSERWRGVTFAARRLQIANKTESAQTAYWLMASAPGTLDWRPTDFRPSLRLLRMSIIDGKVIEAADISSGQPSDSVAILEDLSLGHGDVFILASGQPLTVLLPGDHPIAAYIPVDDSDISITQRQSTFPSGGHSPSIREDYQAQPGWQELLGTPISDAMGLEYPMIDLIGPETILLTEDTAALLLTHTGEKRLNNSVPIGRRMVTAIVVGSPFSTRISAMPATAPIATSGAANVRKRRPSTFRGPDNIPPLGRGEEVVTLSRNVLIPSEIWPRQKGSFEVTISEPLSKDDYSRLAESLRRSDTVSVRGIRSNIAQLDYTGWNFRYPPMPPVDGFYVFGLLAELTLNVHSGQMMIGASSLSIDAPSRVKFKDIRAFTPRHNVVPIPLNMSDGAQELSFSLEATSNLFINDEPVRVRADPKRRIIEYCVALAALVQVLLGAAVALWKKMRSRTQTVS